jgi:two-component system chemotaxis response regulator CheB
MEVKDSKYDTLKVQICDDSALMRNLVSRIINDTPGMEVVGKAMNGKILLDEIPFMKPDIVLLDIEMPVMTGVEFLEERKKTQVGCSGCNSFFNCNKRCRCYCKMP